MLSFELCPASWSKEVNPEGSIETLLTGNQTSKNQQGGSEIEIPDDLRSYIK
jgi:hypothetical protein